MSEPLSSNLVADLRQHASFRKSFPQEYRMVLAAADEIERLAAELAGTKDELYSVDKAAKELGAELDRLKAELTKWNIHGWWDRPKDRPETSPVDSQTGTEVNATARMEADAIIAKRTPDETTVERKACGCAGPAWYGCSHDAK